MKRIIKIRSKVNEAENKCTLEKTNKAKIGSLRRIIKQRDLWQDPSRQKEEKHKLYQELSSPQTFKTLRS